MLEQIPIWFWWFAAVCLVVFIGFLFSIIVWFFNKFIDNNKDSWGEIRGSITDIKEDISLTNKGINDLVIIATKHELRLNHHDQEIIEFRNRIK